MFHVKQTQRVNLPVLCPQDYTGMDMRATFCSRCPSGWDKVTQRCTINTGSEHLPDDPPENIPTCPIQDRCQHQIQEPMRPCVVRRKGLVCESALIESGLSPDDAACHERSFHADTVISPEELADREARPEIYT